MCVSVSLCLTFLEGQCDWLITFMLVLCSALVYELPLPQSWLIFLPLSLPLYGQHALQLTRDLLSLHASPQLLLTEYSSFAWARLCVHSASTWR